MHGVFQREVRWIFLGRKGTADGRIILSIGHPRVTQFRYIHMYCIHRYVLHIYIYIIIYIYTYYITIYYMYYVLGMFQRCAAPKKSGLTPNGQSEGNIPVLDKAFFKAKTHEGCSHPLHGLYSLYSLYNHGLFTKGCLYSLYMLFFDFICSPSIFMKYPRCFHFSRAMSYPPHLWTTCGSSMTPPSPRNISQIGSLRSGNP